MGIRSGKIIACILLTLPLACNEKLPTRENPVDLLRVTSFTVNQGVSKTDRFKIAMRVSIQNLYEETFEDTVNLQGDFHCWWKRHPEIESHYSPVNANIKPENKVRNGRMKIDPGETVFVDYYWYFFTDDGQDILNLLDYSQNDIRFGIQYALPEIFTFEAELQLFRHLPSLTAGPVELEVTGFRPVPEEPN